LYKIIITIILLVIALVIGRMVFLSLTSRTPDTSLVNGKLRPCPATPNCVSSEAQEDSKRLAPFSYTSSTDVAWDNLQQAIKKSGGVVQRFDDPYLWATYTTRIFRYVDDMEFRLEAEQKIIHVRSGSRVGKSDLGVNRKNVEKLRKNFETAQTSPQIFSQ
jgi:uncharacterized protein (DUF1499 family)